MGEGSEIRNRLRDSGSQVRSAFLALASLMYNPPMRRPRVRHHTSDASLEQIRVEGAIRVSRGGKVRPLEFMSKWNPSEPRDLFEKGNRARRRTWDWCKMVRSSNLKHPLTLS